VLSWQDSDGKLYARQPEPSIPATLSPAIPMHISFTINVDGWARIEISEDGFAIRSSLLWNSKLAS
jgi:hypothetical protein